MKIKLAASSTEMKPLLVDIVFELTTPKEVLTIIIFH